MTPGPTAVPRCAVHPEREAVGTCARCGQFLCAEEQRLIALKAFCAACAARPEVDYLEALRLRYWGRRDGWAWLFLVAGLFQAMAALMNLAKLGNEDLPRDALLGSSAVLLVSAVLSGCYWLGLRWARTAVLVVQLAIIGLAGFSPFLIKPSAASLGRAVGAVALPLVVVLAIWNDTRNQLFFRIPVSRERLHKLWNVYSNNPVARAGFFLSFLAVVVGPVALVSIPLCIVGLRRVDPTAHPPQGRREQAIGGLVMSSVGGLGFFALLVLG